MVLSLRSDLLILVIFQVSGVVIKENNVCLHFDDYRTIKTNKNCWYNPDVNSRPHAIAKRYGYKLEDHKVTTQDGYILTMHRISKRDKKPSGPPVFLHHGVCMTSVNWMLNGKRSIAFQLVDYGYDMWLANVRGNDFSMKHVNLSASDPQFWDFSFHEMGMFDAPAAINYIMEKTGRREKITFVGHSMGTSISYIYSSMYPEQAASNVNMLISIAPIAFLGHLKNWLSQITPFFEALQRETRNIGFFGSGQHPKLKKLVKNVCFFYPFINICQAITESILGTSWEQIEPEVAPLFFRRFPGSFSVKTLIHFAQQAEAGGKFQWFDYGVQKNLERYRSEFPPQYDVEKIKIPVFLIYGDVDLLSTEEDTFKLFSKLKSPKYIKLYRGANDKISFNHNDFIYSKHISEFTQFLAAILHNITLYNNTIH